MKIKCIECRKVLTQKSQRKIRITGKKIQMNGDSITFTNPTSLVIEDRMVCPYCETVNVYIWEDDE